MWNTSPTLNLRPQRLIVLGIDGSTLALLDRPQLPNFQRVIRGGVSGTLFSRPAITPVAWSSMVSGKNAGKHGIFDFRKKMELKNSRDKRSKELWDYFPSIVINVPMTYPTRPIDGVMIGDMMTPSLDSPNAATPASEIPRLKSFGYVIEPKIDRTEISRSIEARIRTHRHYIENRDWKLFFHVFREYDSLQHFFWGQDLEDYQQLDAYLGEMLGRLQEWDARLLIASDHGFTPVEYAFDLACFLRRLGLGEEVFDGGWGAVFIEGDNPRTRRELKHALLHELRAFHFDGRRVMDAFPREELYHGPSVDDGPDILVSPLREHGFTFGMRQQEPVERSVKKNGCHTEFGVFVLYGEGIPAGQRLAADIKDIFPTAFELLGRPVPDDGVDGHSIIQRIRGGAESQT